MAFWAVELTPNKAFKVVPPFDLHLTQIVLPASAKDKGRSVVEVKHDDKSFAVGSLKLDGTENISCDVMLEAAKEVTFSVSGNNSVHLTGYYIDHDHDHGDDFSDDDMEGLGGFAGQDEDISSDEDDLDDDSEDDGADEDELTGATLQALTNQKRKADEHQGNGAKKAKVDQHEPEHPKADKKPQQEKAEKKPQQEKAEQKPQQEKAEQKPQQPKSEQKPQTPQAQKPQQPKSEQKTPQSQKPQQPKSEQKPQTPQQPKEQKPQTPQQPKSEQKTQTPEVKEGRTRTEKGVKMETVVIGLGGTAQVGKKVHVMYTGRLENGKVFDKSERPFPFILGAGDVIQGWDIGVKGMRVGEKRRLTIPAALGYGKRGAPPDIPGNATLIFDVELVRI